MKTVTVSARSKTLNDLLTQARHANVLVRSASGEQFVLAQVSSAQSFYVGDHDDSDEEIKATRANKKLMRFLDKRGEQAKRGKLVPLNAHTLSRLVGAPAGAAQNDKITPK